MRRFVPSVMLAAIVGISATGCAAGGGPAGVDPSTDLGDRVLVMVPNLQGPQGERVANELRRLITATTTHAAMDAESMEAAMARYQLTPETFNEVSAFQLAPLVKAKLVSWGSVEQRGGSLNADFKFIDPATQDEIEADASAPTTQQLAAEIFSKFQQAITALSQVSACNDLVVQEQWQQALQACDAVLTTLPTNKSGLTGRGKALTGLQRWADALATYNRVLETDATNMEALLGAARAAGELDRTQDAVALYNRYIDINAATPEARMAVAGTAAQAEDFASAFEILSSQSAANRSNADYQKLLFSVAAAAGARDSTQATRYFPAALEAYQAAYPAGSEIDPQQLSNAIAISVALNRNEDAIRIAGAAAQSRPNDAAIGTLYANALRAAGRHQEAVDALNRLIAANPTAQGAHLARAQSLLELGQTDAALADLAMAAQNGQGDLAATVLIGIAQPAYAAQDWARAAQFAEPAYNYATGQLKQTAATILVFGLYQQAYALHQENLTARRPGPAREIVTMLEKVLPIAQTLSGAQIQQVITGIEGLLTYNRQVAG